MTPALPIITIQPRISTMSPTRHHTSIFAGIAETLSAVCPSAGENTYMLFENTLLKKINTNKYKPNSPQCFVYALFISRIIQSK
jgi:hypothetical protein